MSWEGESPPTVAFAETLRTRGDSLVPRLCRLEDDLWYTLTQHYDETWDHIVVEDPTDFMVFRGGRRARGMATIAAKVGAAFAVIATTLPRWIDSEVPSGDKLFDEEVHYYPTRDWLPRERGHFVKHANVVALARSLLPGASLTDDEAMAAMLVLTKGRTWRTS